LHRPWRQEGHHRPAIIAFRDHDSFWRGLPFDLLAASVGDHGSRGALPVAEQPGRADRHHRAGKVAVVLLGRQVRGRLIGIGVVARLLLAAEDHERIAECRLPVLAAARDLAPTHQAARPLYPDLDLNAGPDPLRLWCQLDLAVLDAKRRNPCGQPRHHRSVPGQRLAVADPRDALAAGVGELIGERAYRDLGR
jgi:hypothetical protein